MTVEELERQLGFRIRRISPNTVVKESQDKRWAQPATQAEERMWAMLLTTRQ